MKIYGFLQAVMVIKKSVRLLTVTTKNMISLGKLMLAHPRIMGRGALIVYWRTLSY